MRKKQSRAEFHKEKYSQTHTLTGRCSICVTVSTHVGIFSIFLSCIPYQNSLLETVRYRREWYGSSDLKQGDVYLSVHVTFLPASVPIQVSSSWESIRERVIEKLCLLCLGVYVRCRSCYKGSKVPVVDGKVANSSTLCHGVLSMRM